MAIAVEWREELRRRRLARREAEAREREKRRKEKEARRQARKREAEQARRTYAEHMANARELWEIRPKPSRKWGQFTEGWYKACDRAYVTAMFYSMTELLFTPAQARDFEAYVQRHGIDRNAVLAEILALGFPRPAAARSQHGARQGAGSGS
jgi:hypothetical protein